jgi:CheY-like chemotaxis protein
MQPGCHKVPTVMHTEAAINGVMARPLQEGRAERQHVSVLSETRRLLWVDDSRPLLSLYKAVFERKGFQVIATTSAREALGYLSTTKVSAAVLDFDMPEMNGGMLASLIKQLVPTLPVILHTGNLEIPDCARYCVDAVCQKSTPSQELMMAIDQLVANTDESLLQFTPRFFPLSSKSI